MKPTVIEAGQVWDASGSEWIVLDATPNPNGRIPVRSMGTGWVSDVNPVWFQHGQVTYRRKESIPGQIQLPILTSETWVPVKKKRRQVSMNGRDWADYDKMEDSDP